LGGEGAGAKWNSLLSVKEIGKDEFRLVSDSTARGNAALAEMGIIPALIPAGILE
jgi:hypothetical protein